MNSLNGIISEERRYASIPYTETGNNHQIFSDIVNSYGLAGCQNQAWCATYQFAMELLMFGKDEALKHWNMTASSYVGYNCFDTEKAFKKVGKTGSTPKVGALVIFKRSHMGRVLSINTQNKTFECGEGNTSNKQYDRNGDSCAVKTYFWNDYGIQSFCYIDYGDEEMNASKQINATGAVYQMAHNLHFTYGDSQTAIPCADHKISCDRLIFRTLWNLGYRDQRKGGETVCTMETWLLKHGWYKITDPNKLQAGDIVLFRNANTTPNAGWHTFLLTDFKSQGDVSKYDCGAQWRIDSAQPFRHVPLNQWNGVRWFYCAFRIGKPTPEPDDFYAFDPEYYRIAYPDVVKSGFGGTDAGLKKHYDQFGKKEGRAANCILDPKYYRGHYKDLKAAFGKDWVKLTDHFTSYGVTEGRRGNIVFDYTYYRSKYKDLRSAYGTDKKKYYWHFLTYGMKEGRQGSADFDPRAYRKRYKDLDRAFGDNWKMYYIHYLVYGIKEKRKPT